MKFENILKQTQTSQETDKNKGKQMCQSTSENPSKNVDQITMDRQEKIWTQMQHQTARQK